MRRLLLDQQPDPQGQADLGPPDAPADDPTLVPQPQPAAPDEAPAERDLSPAEAFSWARFALDPNTALCCTPNRSYDPTPGRWLALEPAAGAPADANLYLYPGDPTAGPPAPEQPD